MTKHKINGNSMYGFAQFQVRKNVYGSDVILKYWNGLLKDELEDDLLTN